MANLLDILNERIVLGDGATGTYLYDLGVPLNHCLEEINVSRPELLARLYREYVEAGRAGGGDEQLWRESRAAGALWVGPSGERDQSGARRRWRARR